jgi:hypothetical protein
MPACSPRRWISARNDFGALGPPRSEADTYGPICRFLFLLLPHRRKMRTRLLGSGGRSASRPAAADMQPTGLKLDLVSLQIADLSGTKTMPVRHQDHGRVAVSPAAPFPGPPISVSASAAVRYSWCKQLWNYDGPRRLVGCRKVMKNPSVAGASK